MADSRYVSELQQLASDVGVTLDIRSDIGDRELVQLYRRAGLFLYAPRLEPFGLAPLEAAACGLITVAVAEAGTRETIADGQNGFLVGADEAVFAQKIDSLLADQDGLKKAGSLARESVERNWGMQQAVERLDCLLRRVAGKAQYSDSREGQ
jgi:glycosyltransferase involved in cell wall biosynthesis